MPPSLHFQDQRELERFFALVDDSDPDGCWPWIGGLNKQGYGRFAARRDRDGKRRWVPLPAHRVSYTAVFGSIPDETLDHLCHTLDDRCQGGPTCLHRRCVRPSHLDPVSELINIQRGLGGSNHREKTHCPQGHEYSGDNLLLVNRTKGRDAGKTTRECRTCWRERCRRNGRAYRARQAAARTMSPKRALQD